MWETRAMFTKSSKSWKSSKKKPSSAHAASMKSQRTSVSLLHVITSFTIHVWPSGRPHSQTLWKRALAAVHLWMKSFSGPRHSWHQTYSPGQFIMGHPRASLGDSKASHNKKNTIFLYFPMWAPRITKSIVKFQSDLQIGTFSNCL